MNKPYPYYYPPPPPRPRPHRPPRRTNLASCILATLFLIFIIIVIFILYFSLLKPKPPKISLASVKFPKFNNTNNTLTFKFSEYLSVHNPNPGTFSHYDSSLKLMYSRNQVGFLYVPAGEIAGGKTEFVAATFEVEKLPVAVVTAASGGMGAEGVGSGGIGGGMLKPNVTDGVEGVMPTLEMVSRMKMAGKVKVLKYFSHHVEVKARCRVDVGLNDGSVLGFHC